MALQSSGNADLSRIPNMSLGSRIRSIIHDPNRRTRTPHDLSKYATDQGKNNTSASPTIQFDLTSVSAPLPQTADVEEAAAPPSLTRKTYRLPRNLLHPEFKEISEETLVSVEPELGEDLPDIEYMRDALEELGPGLLRVLVNVVADVPKDTLPMKIAITVDGQSDYPPPTHIVVLALHCARLPTFPATSPTPTYTSENRTELTVPVQPLGLPSTATYQLLSTFLYTKRAGHLLESLLPCPPPPTLHDDRTQILAFALRLAGTYTSQALLLHVNKVHGLWQNACVLGVFVDALWDTIDLAWEVLLTAMAFSAGTPQLMIKRPSSVAFTSEVASSQDPVKIQSP
ncbi:hypothetical protein B0H13DRAFT_2554563 [Mycena leptocephala]|nr:hypothetical protein B0H13DRAFT_2554563 [Mycena leptocephala]